MKVTTVKLKIATKKTLDTIRREGESYDDTIERIAAKEKRDSLRKRLIAAAKDEVKLDPDWENTNVDWD